MSSKGSSSYTIGYKYYVGMHLVICHAIDALKAIMVGEKIAWTGSMTCGGINIDAPELFGGEDSEGGISGNIDVLDGTDNQGINDYLASVAPSPQPAYRGVVSVVLRQFMVASMNPYLKPWKFLIAQYHSPWHAELATVYEK